MRSVRMSKTFLFIINGISLIQPSLWSLAEWPSQARLTRGLLLAIGSIVLLKQNTYSKDESDVPTKTKLNHLMCLNFAGAVLLNLY